MRVFGVDPGLTRCGLGVVDGRAGRRATLVAVDVVRTPAADGLDRRLLVIAQHLDAWLDEHHPDVVAVERVFSQSNVSTVMGTAQVSGLAVLAAARRGIPVALHTPSEVKAAVTGSGRAGKHQVTSMVTRILALPERPSPADAADALALALCHLWRGTVHEVTPGSSALTESGSATPAQQAWTRATQQARSRSARGFAVPDSSAAVEPGRSPARRVTAVRRPG